MQRLSISYKPEDSSHGELTVTVQSASFAGTSTAWFHAEQLKAFAEDLSSFPVILGNEPELIGGYWKNRNLSQTHVSIRIKPSGPRGKLRVHVMLASPALESDLSHTNSVHVNFLVNYGDIVEFEQKILAMLDGEASEACLEPVPT